MSELRLSYIRLFLREHKEYTVAFKDYYYESVEFVDMVWKEYKANKVSKGVGRCSEI